MSSNSFSFDERGAFYIDEHGLKDMVGAAGKFTGNTCNISVTFDDNYTHENDDVDTLVKHPHFRSNKVESFTIRSSSKYDDDRGSTIRIKCSEHVGQARINADITSKSDDLHAIRADLSREVKAARTNYDLLYRISSFYWFLIFTVLGTALIYWKIAPYFFNAVKHAPEISKDFVSGSASAVGYTLSMFSLWALNRLKLIYYPMLTVAIGSGKEASQKKADTRKWALRAIAAAIIGYAIKEYFYP